MTDQQLVENMALLEAKIERLRAALEEGGEMTDGYDMEATLRLRNNALREAKAEIATLRDQLGEALVRENNLIAALEEIMELNWDQLPVAEALAIARKALGNDP